MNVQIEHVVPDGFAFEREKNVMHGRYGSMELLIVPMMAENQFQIQLYADVENSKGKNQLLGYLQTLQQRHSFVQYAGYNGNGMVSVYVSSREQEDKENLTLVISELTAKCEEYGLHNCCSSCRKARPVHAVTVDRVPALLCQDCEAQLSTGKDERRENLPLGMIGAVLGVLLGSVAWIALGQIGFIAGIAGYIIVFCGIKGYELFGKKLSKAGIIICVILSFLMIAGAEFVSLAITIYKEMGSLFVSSIWDAFGWIPELMQEQELAFGVGKDLVVGYILAIWASYSLVKYSWRQVREKQRPHTIERL